jgi:hypothetical protein
METKMRALIAAAALCLFIAPALAASAKVEAAIKTFKAMESDAAKMKTYCEMTKLVEKMGDKEDKALEAQIDKLIDQLGPAFKTAWEVGDSLDEKTADGKAYAAALDALAAKCPEK